MRFEERELKNYAEPIEASALVTGRIYFSVQFADEDLSVPIMGTWAFAGKSLRSGDKDDILYFQDAESYLQGIRFGTPEANEAKFQIARPNSLNHIFDYEHALDELMRCALRRKKAS
jgi:hypothetical protein